MEHPTKHIPEARPAYDFVFGYLKEQRPFSPGMFGFVLDSYRRTLRKNRLFTPAFRYAAFPPGDNVRYVFVGGNFKELVRGLPRDQVLVVGLFKEWLFCLRHRIPFRSGLDVVRSVLKNAQRQGFVLDVSLARMIPPARPGLVRHLVLFNDSLPVERTYCLLAREAGLRTVCIQHGIFMANSPPRVYDGGVADLMLAIDEHQRRLMISGGIPAGSIRLLGFHSTLRKRAAPRAGGDRKVCILGQPWGAYYPDIESKYHQMIERLMVALADAGLGFAFKPHPSERGAGYLGKYRPVESASLEECLDRYDVFVSFTSTALLEATLAGRVAIQLFHPVFMADRFQDHGYAYSVEGEDWNEVIGLARTAPPLVAAATRGVAERFLEALGEETHGS
jgi:hypothetical protein